MAVVTVKVATAKVVMVKEDTAIEVDMATITPTEVDSEASNSQAMVVTEVAIPNKDLLVVAAEVKKTLFSLVTSASI